MPLVYASRNTSRCPLQDSRPGWIRYFLSCRALASPKTCRFSPAHPGSSAKRKLQTPRRLKVKGSRNCRQFCNCQSHREPQDSTDFDYRLVTISISITYNQQISTSFTKHWNVVRD